MSWDKTHIDKNTFTLLLQIPDIEELSKICPKTRQPCAGKCGSSNGDSAVKTPIGKQKTADGDWLMPQNLEELLAVINQLPQGAKYRLVAGNTGTGNYYHFLRKRNNYILHILPNYKVLNFKN